MGQVGELGKLGRVAMIRGVALITAALPTLVVTNQALAVVEVDHQGSDDGCAEAATYFPEDESAEATRARLRCRSETFARQLEEDRQRKEAEAENQRDKNLQTWMKKQEIPVRVMRRNSVDLYGSGGLTSYGVAGGWLLLPVLEAELWFGRRNVSQWISSGYFQDSRSCAGARFKWLMRNRGNLTPFASIGAADCWANVSFEPYNFGLPQDGSAPPATGGLGTAAAHVATASAGLAWMEKSGLRASFEYVYTYAFYDQATLDDMARTQDPNLRAAWSERLESDRGGVRLQVGYGF
jgi:hypothetical protein